MVGKFFEVCDFKSVLESCFFQNHIVLCASTTTALVELNAADMMWSALSLAMAWAG